MKKNYSKPTMTVAQIALTSMIANISNTNVGLGKGGNTSDYNITEGGAKGRNGHDEGSGNGWGDGLW